MPAFPKYMVKRVIPENAVTIVGDEIHVNIVNVIATIPFDKIPDDFVKSSSIKVDGEVIASGDKPALIGKIKLVAKGKTYPLTDIKSIDELATGETLTLVVPNVKKFAKGETHTFEASVMDRPKKKDPLVVTFERKIY